MSKHFLKLFKVGEFTTPLGSLFQNWDTLFVKKFWILIMSDTYIMRKVIPIPRLECLSVKT